MALIAATGVLFALSVRELLPPDLFEDWLSPGVVVEDIEIDPATGLPIVPAWSDDEVITWTPAVPNGRIESADTWASARPVGMVDPARPTVSLMATYPSHEAAVAVAQGLALAVGDPAAEAAWLEAAGVDGAAGFGWVGPTGTRTPFVQVVDRRLLVDALEWSESFEPSPDEVDEAAADAAAETAAESAAADATAAADAAAGADGAEATYRAPLVLALQASASSLLVEGDRFGEGAIAFDLACIGDAAELLTLEQDLADLDQRLLMRPPWADPPLTLEERRARRTQRLASQLAGGAFAEDLLRSGEMERLTRDLERAADAGDDDATLEALAAVQAHLAELVPAALPDLGPLGQAVDGDVLATALGDLSAPLVTPSPEELLVRARAFGAPDDGLSWRDGSASYEVRAQDRRLWVTLGTWLGIAQGFGPFVGYLDANGCDDIRVVFYDYDDVRGD